MKKVLHKQGNGVKRREYLWSACNFGFLSYFLKSIRFLRQTILDISGKY